jgi:hypothetical protein
MALALLLVLLPETHALRYRFEKGMCYEETTTRAFELTQEDAGKKQRIASSSLETLRRTILEVDETAHPTIERVEVVAFSRTIEEHPAEAPGTVADAAEGKTFVWRRLDERWGLFDGKREVTNVHARLVDRLKNWRDARMPRAPVAVGDTWEVAAPTYLATLGQPVPSEIDGVAVFKLERVENGVATVSFRFVGKTVVAGESQEWEQKGWIRFDVARGRDLESEASGTVRVSGPRGGRGTFEMRRKVVYR